MLGRRLGVCRSLGRRSVDVGKTGVVDVSRWRRGRECQVEVERRFGREWVERELVVSRHQCEQALDG